MKCCSAGLLFLWLLVGSLYAQEVPPLTTDRPGIGVGAGVIAPGVFQLETGMSFDRISFARTYLYGPTLWRYGLAPSVEFRLHVPAYLVARGPEEKQQGFSDPLLGFKLGIYRARQTDHPEVGLLFELRLPRGASPFRAPAAQPSVTLAFDWPLHTSFSFSANGTFTSYWSNRKRFDEGLITATLNVALSEALPAGAYFGYAWMFGPGRDPHYLEGGLTLLLMPDLQLDVNGGVGLHARRTYFIGAGLVQRFRF
ncbi:transporter [Rhodothermus profundi]|uniref:Putative MetA-pathway of phenol degradation n=1 Tax=Rhodothermus profundi TaxID=633813 RepID=A0A1M6TXT5_9BACT|nr:transporter [Rhodothermus profundi]SHK61855.1 Putative MetA-pathway of phenol degradation [Rhodothermus profundi]